MTSRTTPPDPCRRTVRPASGITSTIRRVCSAPRLFTPGQCHFAAADQPDPGPCWLGRAGRRPGDRSHGRRDRRSAWPTIGGNAVARAMERIGHGSSSERLLTAAGARRLASSGGSRLPAAGRGLPQGNDPLHGGDRSERNDGQLVLLRPGAPSRLVINEGVVRLGGLRRSAAALALGAPLAAYGR